MGCLCSKQRRPVQLTRRKLRRLMKNSRGAYNDLEVELKKLLKLRAKTVEEVNHIADELDRKSKSLNFAKLLGSGGAVVGAIICAAGLVIAGGPVAIFAGGAMLAGGSLTTYGVKKYEKVLEATYLDQVQRTIDQDKKQCERLEKIWRKLDNCLSEIIQGIQFNKQTENESDSSYFDRILQDVNGMKTVVSAIGGGVVTGVNLSLVAVIGTLNLTEFISALSKAHTGSPSKIATDIRDKASELQQQYDEWKKCFPE